MRSRKSDGAGFEYNTKGKVTKATDPVGRQTTSCYAANQIDLGSVMGFGFPPFRGGVIYYAAKLTAKGCLDVLNKLEGQAGARFKAWEGIVKRAEKGSGFYETS